MNILISNDDGIDSNGIIKLAEKLSKNNNVLVVAPDKNCSAVSHSISLDTKLKIKECNIKGTKAYSVNGKPADCVKIARLLFKDFVPDVVVSGINKAHNIGSDIFYSGTVAIGVESSFFGHISFVFSAFNHGESDFEKYSGYAELIINQLLPFSEKGDIWNVNFPDVYFDIKGVKITRLGKHPYSDHYIKVGENEYQLVGKPLLCRDFDIDSDVEWIQKGYITVTPLIFNRTDYNKLDKVKDICIKL